MYTPVFALASSVIWAFSPIFYRTFMKRFDFLTLNFLRTAIATLAMAAPALYFGSGYWIGYGFLSGAVTLAVGDSLYLMAVKEVGASVASPVVYTYVLFIQLTAGTVGEVVPLVNVYAAVMVVAGVFVLSRGKGGGKPRWRGVMFGLAAGLVWAFGQDLISLATSAGGNPVTIAFARNFAAACALGTVVLGTGRLRMWPKDLGRREFGVLAAVALSDLVVGSLCFVYSVSLVGVALTVILTSLSPLLTQLFSRAMGKEAPGALDFLGGALIVSALVIAVLY